MLRLTRNQVREIDRRSIEEYHIPSIVLMENAARAVADAAQQMMNHDHPVVLVVCGGGNNGGDGLAVARHLHNRGADVFVQLAVDPDSLRGDAKTNWIIHTAMRLHCSSAEPATIANSRMNLLIDSVFGTGLSSRPRDPYNMLLAGMNAAKTAKLAIDLPSGLDCDSGEPLHERTFRADRTVTFVAAKAGFGNPVAREYTGEVIVGDIGCPRELIEEVARRKV